jgi:hypothetical protein
MTLPCYNHPNRRQTISDTQRSKVLVLRLLLLTEGAIIQSPHIVILQHPKLCLPLSVTLQFEQRLPRITVTKLCGVNSNVDLAQNALPSCQSSLTAPVPDFEFISHCSRPQASTKLRQRLPRFTSSHPSLHAIQPRRTSLDSGRFGSQIGR